MARPVAIVTGAGSGIGAAVTVRLADRYDLIITHLSDDADLNDVLTTVEQRGTAAVAVTGDLTDQTTIDTLAHEVQEATGRVEVLVSNAGAYPRMAWTALDVDGFREQVEINLVTHAACARLVTPILTARRYGRIVAVSSVLTQIGRVDHRRQERSRRTGARPGPRARNARHHRQLRPSGIHRGAAERAVVPDHDAMVTRQLDRQCIQRRGRPDDVAATVDFLASSDAGFITGQCLTVDGGWYLT